MFGISFERGMNAHKNACNRWNNQKKAQYLSLNTGSFLINHGVLYRTGKFE